MKRVFATVLATCALIGLASSASAQVGVPDAFGLQGFIHTQSGAPYDGVASIEVRVYDAETAGTMLYTETIADVDVAGSRFAVVVGAGGSFPTGAYTTVTELFSQMPEVFVAVAIDGNAELPRQRMVTAAFAFRSQTANGAWSLLCADCVNTGHLQDASVTAAKLGITCAEGEVIKNVGGTWTCAADDNTTDVAAGDGIDYSAGVVSIASTNCAAGEILKRNAANDGWECTTDAGSLGSVTSLTGGSGISVSAATGDVTIDVEPATDAILGGVIGGQCTAGEVLAGFDVTGAPVCVADASNTYAAAAAGGLEVNSNEFGIATGGITSAMIADGSIDLSDLAPGVLASAVSDLQINFNANFESGLEDWVVTATEPSTSTPASDADTPDGSTTSVLLESSTTNDGAALASSKTYAVKPGSQITVQFWVSHAGVFPNGGYGSRVVASFYDTAGAEIANTVVATDDADLAWEQKSQTALVPAGAVSVGISDVSIDALTIGAARYDNIQIFASSPDLAAYMPNAFPSGSVMHFDRQSCPPGWSVLTEAVGRTVVGMDGAGTLKGTRGTAFTDLENRSHAHEVNPPNTTSTSTGSHNHDVNPVAVTSGGGGSHSHTVNPPATTSSSDVHNHLWGDYDGVNKEWNTWDSVTTTDSFTDGGKLTIGSWGDGMNSDGAGNYPLSRNNATSDNFYTDDDSHSHSVDIASVTSSTQNNHTHSVNVANTTSTSDGNHTHNTNVVAFDSDTVNVGSVIPYIQLLVCKKD